MFVMGILAVLQVAAIPGGIAYRALKIHQGILQSIVTIFMLSLTINYVAGLALVALGLYLRPVALALLALEVLALAWLYRRAFLTPLGAVAQVVLARSAEFLLSFVPKPEPDSSRAFAKVLKAALGLTLGIMAVSSIAWVGRVFIDNLGSVFNSWDAVLSWNRWALAWSQNQFPSGTWQYPQLLPLNWSMIYVITGSSMQLFSKAIMPLFSLFILLMIFDLGLDAARAGSGLPALGFFLAVVITRLMLKKFLGDYITEGYADIPVAFAGFVPIYTLLKARQLEDASQRVKAAQLGMLLAGGAAVAKAAGVVTLGLYPLLAWLVLDRRPGLASTPSFKKRGEESKAYPFLAEVGGRPGWRSMAPALGAALLIALPWYAFKQAQIWQGSDQSNVAIVTSAIYEGAGLGQRALAAWQSLGKYAYLIAFLVLALPVFDRAYRWIVALVVLPFCLSWALFFSYDTRNLALALPLIGLAGGVALGRLAELGIDLLAQLRSARLRAYSLAALGLLALAGVGLLLPDQKLEAQQVEQQREIFSPELNARLYDYVDKHGPEMRIATNYPVAALPGLEQMQVNFWYQDFDTYQGLVANGEVNYLLAPSRMDGRIEADIEQNLASGAYKLLFEDDGYVPYRFIKIVKRGERSAAQSGP